MKYRLQITALSPLHIGTGGVLLKDYDFCASGKRTWVLDQEAILRAEYDGTGKPDWRRLSRPPGELVEPGELREGSAMVRYSLAGTTTIEQVREQIKDPFGRCYLPGSSLKGALRSALMSHAVRSKYLQPDGRRLGRRREWAGQDWERQALGRDPNHDLLRALIVGDSAPLPKDPSPLMLLSAQVFGTGKPGSPIVTEAIRPDTTFCTTLRVDEYLTGEAAGELGLDDRRGWLARLPAIVRAYSKSRIAKERRFLSAVEGLESTARFYADLAAAKLPAGACLLQIGWGGGWTSKSVGPWLPRSLQAEIRRRYQLGRPPRARRDWRPDTGKPFPKSRRLRARRVRGQSVGGVPLGWALITFQEEQG